MGAEVRLAGDVAASFEGEAIAGCRIQEQDTSPAQNLTLAVHIGTRLVNAASIGIK